MAGRGVFDRFYLRHCIRLAPQTDFRRDSPDSGKVRQPGTKVEIGLTSEWRQAEGKSTKRFTGILGKPRSSSRDVESGCAALFSREERQTAVLAQGISSLCSTEEPARPGSECEPAGAAWVGKEVLSVPQLTSGQQGRCPDDSPDGLEPSCQAQALNQRASALSGLAIKDRTRFPSCSSGITEEANSSFVLATGSPAAVTSYPFRSRNVSATT